MNCRRCKSGPYAAQQGAALVIAMLVFALCATLIVAMKSEFILFYQRGSNIFVAEQAYAYLRGAEDLASLALVADADQDSANGQRRDDLEELWAQPSTPYSLDEGGWLQGGLEDLQGRFNLNQLVGQRSSENGGESYTIAQQQFIRLLQALPELELSEYEAAIITRSIGDWLDGDNNTSVNGAEDDYYSGQTPPYRTANQPMSSVSELRAVANVTSEIYAALSPWVSVWPQSPSTLNIHTAPAMLLRSINDDGNLLPLSDLEAEALVQQRADTGFVDVADFLAQPAFEGKNMSAVATLLGEESGYFLLAAEAEVAERRVRLYSVLERRGRTINTLTRASGSL
ncbi:MAG: type II secretion system minor pseudopilin GspK [Halioglobus sp.]